MAQPLYLVLVLSAAVVGMGVAFVAWLRRDRPGARPLVAFVVAASFWAVADGLSVASARTGTILFWRQIALSLSVVIPVAWLVTVLEYTGRDHWLTRRTLAFLLVEPVAFLVLVWTNDGHHLVWSGTDIASVGPFNTFVLEF